jgi:hypothetical protein
MKKLLMGIGISVLTILMLIGTSLAYTYDGDVDPVVFQSWEQTSETMMYEPAVEMVGLKNTTDKYPDVDTAIIYLVNTARGVTVLAYQYHSKSTDKTRYFELHPVTGSYDEVSGFDDGTFEERYTSKLQ